MDQVFISHSSRNEDIAAAICDRFEKAHLRCWMASRDALPGENFARSIVDAIDGSRLMLVVLSKDASESVHVISEINRAVDQRVPILPVRVDDAALTPEFNYYLGRTHWFDASRSPLQAHLDDLAGNVQRLLGGQRTAMPVGQIDEPERPVDLEGLQIPPEQVADRDKEMEKRLSYSVQVSRNKPACLIMLVDQSFSMNFSIAGTDTKKKDAVADVVNNVLYNAVLASTKGDGVRHYFDVGVLGYGADEGVKSAFDTDLVPIEWAADNFKGWVHKEWDEDDGEGGKIQVEDDYPVWLMPFAKGRTLMKDAFERALAVVSDWAEEHKDSFPPIVLHITDGGYTSPDQDPALAVRKLQEQYTNVGSALVFNCHLSEKEGQAVMYPSAAATEGLEVRARKLYEMSSPLPEPMRQEAVMLGYQVEMGARGYVRNADAASLVHFLDIGTRPVWGGVVEA